MFPHSSFALHDEPQHHWRLFFVLASALELALHDSDDLATPADDMIRNVGYDDTEYGMTSLGEWYVMIRRVRYDDTEYGI